MKKNHYEVLEVSSSATYDEIKTAYHNAARRHHPDKLQQQDLSRNNNNSIIIQVGPDKQVIPNQTAHTDHSTIIEESFHRIQLAWECLRNSDFRNHYDKELLIHSNRTNFERQRKNAIILCPSDCNEEKDCDNNDTEDEMILSYDCRCGQRIVTSDLDVVDSDVIMEDDHNNGRNYSRGDDHASDEHRADVMFHCPGCSLKYVLVLGDD
jgi:curved DNA-binding protein CbpA